MKTLEDYTTQELFDELCGREDVIAVKIWTRTDVLNVAKRVVENDYPELTGRVDDIVDIAMDGNYDHLTYCMTSEWDVIEAEVTDAISEIRRENDGKEEERVSEHTTRA